VDGRADLYALACTAFEMLAGSPPHRRDYRLAVLGDQLSQPPPPLTGIRPGLPPAVDQVMARALARSPDDRYQRCQDLAAALSSALGQAGAAAQAGVPGRASGSGLGGPPVPGPGRDDTRPGLPVAADAGYPRATDPRPGWVSPPLGPEPPAGAGTGPPGGGPPGTGPPGGGAPADPATRPWWRSRMVPVLLALVAVGVAGTVLAVTHRGRAATVALAPPGCVTAAAPTARLAGVRPSFVTLAGMPFAVALTGDGRWSFVSTGTGHSIEVLRSGDPLAPTPVRRIRVAAMVRGEAITPDGRYLLAATGSGAAVVSVARAEQGRPGSVLGTLASPGGAGAVEVTVSPDGRFAFVTLEDSGTMAVFNLQAALASGLRDSGFVGAVRLGINPIGLAVSRDGQWLYATAQKRTDQSEQGTLSVLSVPRAETDPAGSVVARALAGCDPGRVITTSGGSTVWVTARESNALLAFSAARLRTDPGRALIARVRVGQRPIGLTVLRGGDRILVANSNMHPRQGTMASLGVVDAAAALAGRPALLGLIQTGTLPREVTMVPGGQAVLVTNSASHQLEAVNVSGLK
jgi:DNA-binding beta-propeller fold protein YncE